MGFVILIFLALIIVAPFLPLGTLLVFALTTWVYRLRSRTDVAITAGIRVASLTLIACAVALVATMRLLPGLWYGGWEQADACFRPPSGIWFASIGAAGVIVSAAVLVAAWGAHRLGWRLRACVAAGGAAIVILGWAFSGPAQSTGFTAYMLVKAATQCGLTETRDLWGRRASFYWEDYHQVCGIACGERLQSVP
jgi:hypothetical protein